jgi:mono/diheme cytochrome c family protein
MTQRIEDRKGKSLGRKSLAAGERFTSIATRVGPATWLFAASVLAVAGCGSPHAEFRRYETYAHKVVTSVGIPEEPKERRQWERWWREARQEVDEILQALFGTPDEPALPDVEGINSLVRLSRLEMAAGPVGSDQDGRPRGLYREHCAHCHGVTGDGAGPTAAFLNPYPRDYRKGQFKFKSTPVGARPTHSDLKKILLEGIPGTAMPSFQLLPDLEVEALVDYVKYLAIRGEVERRLLSAAAELDVGGRLIAKEAGSNKEERDGQIAAIKEMVAETVARWTAAEGQVVEIPPRPSMTAEELAASIQRGRTLFYGTVANCVKCHGDSALGDGQTTDYDEWTKEFIGDGKDPKLVATYVSLGMLPPRTIRPRNLRLGIYRGGMRPIDLYWRIKNGIEGTPMPAATMKPEGDPHAKGLTPEDIWDLVNYVQALPYESINNPLKAAQEAQNIRERL